MRSFSLVFDLYKQKGQAQKLINTTLYSENQLEAQKILNKYGKESLDYFKLVKDKSIFVHNNTFIAYQISGNSLVVLGDPVGPESELLYATKHFIDFCKNHGWNICFFQCSDRNLEFYKSLDFEKIRIGSEAIVDIKNFNLQGPKKKDFRNRIRKLEKLGFFIKHYKERISDELFAKLQIISDEWLDEPNRIERSFSLGYFSREYIDQSEVITVENNHGEVVAFVNLIPSYKKGEITIDLMRKSKTAPSGVMDYLFVKAILEIQKYGFETLSLGLAPMSSFQEKEQVSFTEFTIYSIFKRLNFLFNYEGLKVFKKKFATSWEPKFLVYKNASSLPALALSIKNVLEEVGA